MNDSAATRSGHVAVAPKLAVRNCSITFHRGQTNELRALDGIDLELQRGEHVVIVGSNGAGKSTLLNLVCGRMFPDHGAVELDGRDITALTEPKRARRIGRVFQDPMGGTAAPMTIAENLALAECRARRRRFRIPRSQQMSHYRDQLTQLGMGLEDRMDVAVGGLSGGQRQALALLMAVSSKPELLVLDEHTAALDPGAAHRILELTTQLVTDLNLTTLMITHNMQHAIDTGDRTVMMHRGSIVLDVEGAERDQLTVTSLVDRFRELRAEVSDKNALV